MFRCHSVSVLHVSFWQMPVSGKRLQKLVEGKIHSFLFTINYVVKHHLKHFHLLHLGYSSSKQTNKLLKPTRAESLMYAKKVSSKLTSYFCPLVYILDSAVFHGMKTWKYSSTILIITFFTTAYRMRFFIVNFFLGMLLVFNFILNCCEY